MNSTAISYLFVPASRPERYGRALAAGADRVIVDLEDAVAEEDKGTSLGHLIAALEARAVSPVHVRINAADTPWFEDDLAALATLAKSARSGLSGVILPKAEAPGALRRVRELLGDEIELVALVESALGLKQARALAETPGISRFALGAVDLSFDLDTDIASRTIDYAYSSLVLESRLAGLPAPIASPPLSIKDPEKIREEASRLRSLGLGAQLCIHPAQVDPIHAGFLPSLEQVAWAKKVLTSMGGAVQVEGQMVDKPVRDRAERVVALHNRQKLGEQLRTDQS